MDAKPEEQFVVFFDLLGTRQAIEDEQRAPALLKVLTNVASWRSEFQIETQATDQLGSRKISIKPAVSVFSDHVVISYSLERIRRDAELNLQEHVIANIVHGQVRGTIATAAAHALELGFLLRGGATIGKLFHERGIIFGEALVEAYLIESGVSNYPRIVVSQRARDRKDWSGMPLHIGEDGLAAINYWPDMVDWLRRPEYRQRAIQWINKVVEVIEANFAELRTNGRLNEFAKWAWFAREFRTAIERLDRVTLGELGLSVDQIPAAHPRYP